MQQRYNWAPAVRCTGSVRVRCPAGVRVGEEASTGPRPKTAPTRNLVVGRRPSFGGKVESESEGAQQMALVHLCNGIWPVTKRTKHQQNRRKEIDAKRNGEYKPAQKLFRSDTKKLASLILNATPLTEDKQHSAIEQLEQSFTDWCTPTVATPIAHIRNGRLEIPFLYRKVSSRISSCPTGPPFNTLTGLGGTTEWWSNGTFRKPEVIMIKAVTCNTVYAQKIDYYNDLMVLGTVREKYGDRPVTVITKIKNFDHPDHKTIQNVETRIVELGCTALKRSLYAGRPRSLTWPQEEQLLQDMSSKIQLASIPPQPVQLLHPEDNLLRVNFGTWALCKIQGNPKSFHNVLFTDEAHFNQQGVFSRARRVAENGLGKLAARFRIFERPIPLNVTTTEQIVRTTCALHK
ncbi:hypothetical protein ILUMI_27506 [Ignelater luminosus]|uniref:Uncharacterized protein n=1 Tax=Ignelater luminosus TaxID=2038154 RepID=A0A8K0FY43_IGNLU|nr:hypothetical protein ILUMI_27506 [Ignelater luminosus]